MRTAHIGIAVATLAEIELAVVQSNFSSAREAAETPRADLLTQRVDNAVKLYCAILADSKS